MEAAILLCYLKFLMFFNLHTNAKRLLMPGCGENCGGDDDVKGKYRVSNFKDMTKIPVVSNCHVSLGNSNGFCHKFQHENWFGAEQVCRRNGMRLATIKGKHAAQHISDTIIEAVDDYQEGFWTSGNDLAELGKFYWMSTGEEISRYTNWRRGEPSKEERSYQKWYLTPHCIYLERVRRKFLWNYDKCAKKYYFVCEEYNGNW